MHPNSIKNLREPIKKGEVLNKEGRKHAGTYLKEAINALSADDEMTTTKLRNIAKDPSTHPIRAAAAIALIRMTENPDVADFEGVLDGQLSLAEVRDKGVATTSVKKVRRKIRYIPAGEGNEPIKEVENEIDMYDRHGESFDRVRDTTAGKPKQTLDVSGAATATAIQIQFLGLNAPSGIPNCTTKTLTD